MTGLADPNPNPNPNPNPDPNPNPNQEAPSEEEFEEDLEEEVVERDALKKQSGAILDKLNKKARKGGRKKKAAD